MRGIDPSKEWGAVWKASMRQPSLARGQAADGAARQIGKQIVVSYYSTTEEKGKEPLRAERKKC